MSGGEQQNFFKNTRKSIGELYEEATWRRVEGFPDPNEPFKLNPDLEFDAPHFYEEGANEEKPEEYIDPWFLRPHPELRPKKLDINQPGKQKVKKKKFSEFSKENKEAPKKPEPSKFKRSFNTAGCKSLNLGTKENMSLNTNPNLCLIDKSNIPKSQFRPAVNVSLNATQIGKVKRGISKDTYNYYATHQNLLINSTLGGKVSPIKKPASVNYVPRIHNEKVMKKWSSLHNGANWYSLSPRSRDNANKEMTEMIKEGLI